MNQLTVISQRELVEAIQYKHKPDPVIPYKVAGKSMEPSINQGAYVGIDLMDKEICSGKTYAIALSNLSVELRRLYMGHDAAVFKADNPTFPDITIPLEKFNLDIILGRVKWVAQEF